MSPLGARSAVGPPYLEGVSERRLARFSLEFVPTGLPGYVEPFLDAGSVAIGVMRTNPDASFTLAAGEPGLVEAWERARDDPEGLITAVGFQAERHGAAYFAAERDLPQEDVLALSPAARAARFVYLRGTAAPDARGEPRRDFRAAPSGREVVAFDRAGIRALSALLRAREVVFDTRPPFELLREVREDDLVYLDPPFEERPELVREVRSFVGAVTARGAAVLAPEPAPSGDPLYGTWPGMVRIGDRRGVEAVWGNGSLVRTLRRQTRDAS